MAVRRRGQTCSMGTFSSIRAALLSDIHMVTIIVWIVAKLHAQCIDISQSQVLFINDGVF